MQHPCHRIDVEHARSLGIGVAWDILAIGTFAGHKPVTQAVAVGVVCRRIMIIRLSHTTFIDRRIEQLHRVVEAQEGIDHQLCLDIHRHVDRVGDVHHAVVTVRVLHADDVVA